MYDDPNLSKEESEDMYMNSSMVAAVRIGSTTQLGGESSAGSMVATAPQGGKDDRKISVQMDSGFDQEHDETWPAPELPDAKHHHYQNVKILREEYAKTANTSPEPPTAQYTALKR